MANRTASIWKHIKLDGKWRFAAVYQNPKKHKLEGNNVVIGGQVVEHPEGVFYISWYEGSNKKWKKIGPKLRDAELAAELREYQLEGNLPERLPCLLARERPGHAGAHCALWKWGPPCQGGIRRASRSVATSTQ
jgi:hypothetical protein